MESVKNALLSHALYTVFKDDIDEYSYDYTMFDGTKLPMFSGYTTTSVCFSYIVDKTEFKGDPFCTHHMLAKAAAIDTYLDRTIRSYPQAISFFNAYIKNH